MKKTRNIIFLFLIVLTGIFMASCGDKDKADRTELESVKELLNVRFTNSGDTLTNVTGDLTLPATFGGATITWNSSNVDVITNAGVVTRDGESKSVTLTATIKVNKLEDIKRFNITVAAVILQSYEVRYNTDGGSPASFTDSVREGNMAEQPDNPTKDRYTFLGWFIEDEDDPFDFETPITDHVSLKAKWELAEALISFNLGYPAPVQLDPLRVAVGQKATQPTNPTRNRYAFDGWFLDGSETAFDFANELITKDMVLTAKWIQNEVVVSFDLGYDAEAPFDQNLVIGDKVNKPADPVRDRFEFLGWAVDGEEGLYDFSSLLEGDLLLVAQWDQLEALVTFNSNGGTPTPESVTLDIGGKVDEPAEPIRPGYLFVAWLDGANVYNFDLEVERDLVLVAQWVDSDIEVNAVIGGPDAVTYYLGSTPFDPLAEFWATDEDTDEPLDLYVSAPNYRLIPGTFYYDVAVIADPGIKKTVKLTIKPKENIPLTLGKGEIEIIMWHSNGSVIENKLKGYAQEFEDLMRADGHNVSVVIDKPAATYDDLRSTVINAIKGAELPNLVQNYPDHVVEYDNNGVIESLTPYIFHPTYGMDPTKDDERLEDIVQAYRNENKSNNLIGDYLSLPFNKSTEVAVYNKTFFDAVLRGRAFPETWQDLFALYDDIMEIKDEQIDLIASRWEAAGKGMTPAEIQEIKDNFVPFTLDSMGNAFITLTRQFGGAYTSRNPETGIGSIDFVNNQTKRMLQFFAEEPGFTVPQYWGVDYANDVSMKGTTIFTVGSTGGLRYNTPVENGIKLFDIGVAPVPYDNQNPSSRTAIQQGTNISLTTSGNAEQKLVSWLFLKYLTSKDVQSDFGISTGYSPVRASSYETPEFQAYLSKASQPMADSAAAAGLNNTAYKNEFEAVVTSMGGVVMQIQKDYMFYDEAFIGSSKSREAVGEAFERVMLYSGSSLLAEIEAALLAAKEEAERVL